MTSNKSAVCRLRMILPAILLFGMLGLLPQRTAHAAGTLISAPQRVDMVHDYARNVLYITQGSDVLRYDLGTDQFLSPFQLSGNLAGLDLSPDGTTLVVADEQSSDTEVWVHLIDVASGAIRKASFPRASSYESGTFTVAFGNDGNVLIASSFQGSGWVPMRSYNLATGAWKELASVRQDTMLASSADGSVIGFAESNSSDGPFGRYRVTDGNLLRKSGYTDGTGWFNYEIGANRNGTQYALPTYGGTFVYDANLTKIATIGTSAGPQPIGVVYHPNKDLVYFAWSGSTEVRAYDTTTFAQVAAYDFGYTFVSPGNRAFLQGRLKMSRDGSLLFATVDGGIRYVRLGARPPVAYDGSVQINEDTTAAVPLRAQSASGGPLTYTVLTNPQHGTLSGVAPNLTYTPAPNYNGPDNFTFKATDGTVDSNTATVTINVLPVNDPPDAVDDTATTPKVTALNVPVLRNDTDVDNTVLTITKVTQGANGSVTINADGTVKYVPQRTFVGTDTFAYTIIDGSGGTDTAKVTVTVTRK